MVNAAVRLWPLAAVAMAFAAARAECRWTNLGPGEHLAGRIASPGYLRGKIVMLDRRDYGRRECVDDALKLQETWSTYKTKDFVLVGGHCGQAGPGQIARIAGRLGLTYPIYAGTDLATDEAPPSGQCGITVYDTTSGRRLYCGHDVRTATGVAGTALMNLRVPSSPKQWKRILDYEFELLPGRACLRLRELENDRKALAAFGREYAGDLERYRELSRELLRRPAVRKLVKLVELSRQVKDRDPARTRKLSAKALEQKIESFAGLKSDEDGHVAQEAKNALAELAFAKAIAEKTK